MAAKSTTKTTKKTKTAKTAENDKKTLVQTAQNLEIEKEEFQKDKKQFAREKAKMLADVPKGKLHGFAEFIREKGVVGLAIGLSIGTAATALVTQIVGSVISPTVGLLVGKNGLDSLNTTISMWGRSETFRFGDLIDALIKFIAMAAVIYFVVMGLKLDKLDKKKE
jgi:large conductance mechanosensitive channel